MEMTTKEEALARRRAQNREAQRRFRRKQGQQREKASAAAESRPEPQRSSSTIDADTSAEMLMENFTIPTPDEEYGTDGCFITTGLRLFGNYTLLDSFNMQGCPASDEVVQVMNDKSMDLDMDLDMDIPTALTPIVLTPPESERHSVHAVNTKPRGTTETTSQTREEHLWPPLVQAENPTSSVSQTVSYNRSLEGRVARPQRGTGQPTPPEGDSTPLPSSTAQGWMSSLHIAAQNGNDRIVRMLLRHQSDSNERDSDGLTPLYYATIGGHEQVVTSLLERGAHVSSTDKEGRTMLHLAVVHRRDSVLKALLRYCTENQLQSPIDEYDDTGRTPLHVAVDIDFEAGVSLLLEHGANLNSKARKS